MRFAPAQAVHPGADDLGRRHEIRLADAEADDVFHRRGDVEKAADARRRDTGYFCGNEITHGILLMLGSRYLALNTEYQISNSPRRPVEARRAIVLPRSAVH